MALLIDSLGAPGSYKSKTMLDLTSLLKSYFSHYSLSTKVEYCPEYVKDAIWEGDSYTIGNQAIVFGNQFRNIERLKSGGVDIICSDSALLLSVIYANPNKYPREEFMRLIRAHYENCGLEILPVYFKPDSNRHYQKEGRRETQQESDAKDLQIYKLGRELFGERIFEVIGNNKAVFKVFNCLIDKNYIPVMNNNKSTCLKEFVKQYLEENACIT